jgi:hypothetical protein
MESINTKLFNAIINQNLFEIDDALSKGADINYLNLIDLEINENQIEKSNSAFHLACFLGKQCIINKLLNYLCLVDINLKNNNGYNAIHYATFKGHYELVEYLISLNCNLYDIDINGNNSLHIATKFNSVTVSNILLNNKIDINARNKKGETALYIATENNNRYVTELLLINNADVNIKCKYNISPLHNACENGCLFTVETLLNKKAEINCIDVFNYYPIQNAINKGPERLREAHIDIVRLLLSKGSNIRLENINNIKNNYIIDIINKWPTTMIIILLQELSLYNEIDDLSIYKDLYEYSLIKEIIF